MLVRINPTINTTDTKAMAINFLRCIRAVCTAGAGTTPSVQPVTAPSTFGAGDCIVEVIANAEAGGWTESSSTTFTTPSPVLTGSQVTTAYNASYAGVYFVDLYNSATGKTTYPYYKQTFATSLNASNYFSGAAWATYPHLDMVTGFHTATTIDGNYLNGFNNNAVGYTSRCLTSNQFNQVTANLYAYTTYAMSVNAGEFLIASTSQYIIIIGGSGIVYWGNRSNAQWENSFTNNPYNIAFSYNCNGVTSTWSAINAVMGYFYGTDGSGTISATPGWKQGMSNSGINADPLSGYSNATTSWSYAYNYGTAPGSGWITPLIPFGLRSHNINTMVGPSTDSSTGANVPPAYPIVAAHIGSATNNSAANADAAIRVNTGMVLPGIYRSLAGPDAFINSYYTAGTTYVVGTENYYPYLVGQNSNYRDMFLLRKY